MGPTWSLEDVELAAAASRTFFLPSRSEREQQQVGSQVRLHFLLKEAGPGLPRAERMWVHIEKVESGRYFGVLTNQPGAIKGLNRGDRLWFEPRHIARVTIHPDHPDWLDCGEQTAIISIAALEPDKCVRFLYRDEPDEEDSGWVLLEGAESEEYKDDSKNFRVVDVGWLLDTDPTLLQALRAGAGAAFERESRDTPWVEVTATEPEEPSQ